MERLPAFAQKFQPEEPELLFRLRSDMPSEPAARIRQPLRLLLDEMTSYTKWKPYLDTVEKSDHIRILEHDIRGRISHIRTYLIKVFDALPQQMIEPRGLLQWFRQKVTPVVNELRIKEAVRERMTFEMRRGMFRPGALESIESHVGFDVSRSLEQDLRLLVPEKRLAAVRENVRGATKYMIALDEDVHWDAKRPIYHKKG